MRVMARANNVDKHIIFITYLSISDKTQTGGQFSNGQPIEYTTEGVRGGGEGGEGPKCREIAKRGPALQQP